MGNMWMLFKKFDTVYDMFMVQKWLRNGQQYGFVRFKLVADANTLLKRLREIRFGDEYLMALIAFDRRNTRVSGLVDNNDAGNANNGSERREVRNMEDKKEEHTKLGVNKETREDKEDVTIIKVDKDSNEARSDMVIFDNESNNESSEGETNSDEEEVEEGAGHEFWPPDGGGRNVDVVKESRGEHPVTSNSSGGDRLNKKRRENEDDFKEINKVKVFVNGTDDDKGTKGLGNDENEPKDFLEARKDGNEVFAFRSSGRMDSSSKSCSINMEQVKEIGELIGVSWVRAENEKTNEAASKLEKKDKEVRGDEEIMDSQVNLKEANDFNDFINEAKLIKIPIGGRKYTRVSDDGMKLYAQVQSHLYPVDRVGYKTPSTIHMATIPLGSQQRDVIVVAGIDPGCTLSIMVMNSYNLKPFTLKKDTKHPKLTRRIPIVNIRLFTKKPSGHHMPICHDIGYVVHAKRRVVLKDISKNPFYGSNIKVVNGVKAQI
ncbi:transposon TX1 [Tanacetum coccineum]